MQRRHGRVAAADESAGDAATPLRVLQLREAAKHAAAAPALVEADEF